MSDEEQRAFGRDSRAENNQCQEAMNGNAQELERQVGASLAALITLLFLDETR